MSYRTFIKKHFVFFLIVFSIFFIWSFLPSEAEKMLTKALLEKRNNPEHNKFDGIIEPEIPKEEINTILGTDTNDNKIRDDVEIYINREYSTYNERMVARQYVSDLTYILLAAEKDNAEIIGHAISSELTTFQCMSFLIGYEKSLIEQEKLRLIVNNTNDRRKVLDNIDKHVFSYGLLNGMILGESYKGCNFKVENEVELKELYFEELQNARREYERERN